jgi:hypothetical protein
MGMLKEEWDKLEKRENSLFQLFLIDLVLLNFTNEETAKKVWDNLGSLYLWKSLVNKLFLMNKLYLIRMHDGSSVT